MHSGMPLKIIYERPRERSSNLSLPRPADRVVVRTAEVKLQLKEKKKVKQTICPSPDLTPKLLRTFWPHT